MPLTGFIRVGGKMINPDHVIDTDRLENQPVLLIRMAKGNTIRAEGEEADRVEREFQQARIQPAVPSWSERARWSNDAFKIARDLGGLIAPMPAHPARDGLSAVLRRIANLSEEIGRSCDAVDETAIAGNRGGAT